MTAEPEFKPPSERPGTEYTERLVTRIPPAIGKRLRLLAVLRRRPLQHVLAEALDKVLPTDAQLAEGVTTPAGQVQATIELSLSGKFAPEHGSISGVDGGGGPGAACGGRGGASR
jgi:hypothetical protein